MSDDVLAKLLPAIGIAAFVRDPDGGFSAVAPLPSWFRRVAGDETFPFLGHVLEEANHFWQANVPGSREWGPSVATDEAGGEFHYKVVAVSVPEVQYLVFAPDPGADRLRELLQKARERALAAEADAGARSRMALVQSDIRQARAEIRDVIVRLLRTGPTEAQRHLLEGLHARADALVTCVDALVEPAGTGGPGSPRP